jgi:hypothetical protein
MRRLVLTLCLAGCVLEKAELAPDLCNGLDDDGDPTTDDGSDEPALGRSCDGSDADACTAERIACVGGQLVCNTGIAISERCNGLDDDCDGEVDEGFAFASDPANCGFCGNACRNANGTTACVGGACIPACVDGATDCNGNPSDGCEVFRDRNPTCQAATPMGSLGGDAIEQSIELTGTDEATLDVIVLEQSMARVPLTAALVLDNPPDVNFDLFVSCSACGGAIMGSSTNPAGMPDRVVFRAEDADFVNDSRTLHVEVRFASATTCAAPWRLVVTGAVPVATTTCGP